MRYNVVTTFDLSFKLNMWLQIQFFKNVEVNLIYLLLQFEQGIWFFFYHSQISIFQSNNYTMGLICSSVILISLVIFWKRFIDSIRQGINKG